MSVAFHPDPASVIARQARLGIPRSRPIVFRPAPAIPPAPGAAETAGPVAILPADSAPPVEAPEPPPAKPVHRYDDGSPLAVEIIDMVAFWHGYTREDILGFARNASLVTARYDAIAAVAECKPDYSPELYGRIFRRDRTTIVYALQKIRSGPRVRKRPPRSASSSGEERG